MTKEKVLYLFIGVLIGCVIGFIFTNTINQRAMKSNSVTASNLPANGLSDSSKLPPNHPDAQSVSGGMQPEIKEKIDKAKSNPKDFVAQVEAAKVYYQIERYDGVVEYLTQANKLKPDDYETIVGLGNAYFDWGKYADAEKWYALALTKKTDDTNVRTDFGLTFIFREKPDYDRAITEFMKVLEKDPKHIQALQNLTVAFTKQSNQSKANETLNRLKETDPQNNSIARLQEDIQKISTN